MVLLVALLVMGATGCSSVKRIEVTSDTCWVGAWNGTDVEGCGRAIIETRAGFMCYTLKKTTRRGYLRVRVLRGTGDNDRTDESFGRVSGCVQ